MKTKKKNNKTITITLEDKNISVKIEYGKQTTLKKRLKVLDKLKKILKEK